LVSLTVLIASLIAMTPSGAAAAPAGAAVITLPDQVTPLNSGGSTTLFSFKLPPQAHCAGDTTRPPYYFLYSYLVPKGTDPSKVNYGRGIPDRGLGFRSNTAGRYFGAINLAKDTGQIIGVPPDFSWKDFSPADILPGGAATATWEGGLACAVDLGAVSAYWNVELEFTRSRSDPNGFVWMVTQHVATPKRHFAWWGVIVMGVASLAAIGVIALSRRADDPEPTDRHRARSGRRSDAAGSPSEPGRDQLEAGSAAAAPTVGGAR